MKLLRLMPVLLIGLVFQSCSSAKQSIFWVSGEKTDCSAGAGKMKCLSVSKDEDLTNAKWETFYAPIVGFNFEEGYLQKIKVKEEKLDPSQVPADASSIKYTLVDVLEKVQDPRSSLQGTWVPVTFNGGPINRMVTLPKLNINVKENRISGTDGCNNYTAPIVSFTSNQFTIGNIGSTQKMCDNKNIADDYNRALGKTASYILDDKGILTLLDDSGNSLITFVKENPATVYPAINGGWTIIRINSGPINRMSTPPNLNIDLNSMMINGNNSCNNFTGKIKDITDNKIYLGTVAVDRRMCQDMQVANEFNTAVNRVTTYKVDSDKLVFYDESGNEVLAFIKASSTTTYANINKAWTAVGINGGPINRMATTPTMTIDLQGMTVSGNNGCNNFSGKITSVNDNALHFGNVAAGQRMCRDMQVPDAFNKAINTVKTYKVNGNKLSLYDMNGNEVLTFIPAM